MKSNVKIIFKVGILLVITLAFVIYLLENIDDFKKLSFVSPKYVLIFIGIILLNLYFSGKLTQILLRSFGIDLGSFEAFGLSIVSKFYNLIFPLRGGAAVRAVYLKKKHNLHYSDFISIFAATNILTFLFSSLFGLISLIFLYFNFNQFSLPLFLLFSSFFCLLTFLAVFSPHLQSKKHHFLNSIVRVINGWRIIKRNQKLISKISLVIILQLVLGSFNVWISYQIFGINIEFSKALFISSLASVSSLVSIAPGNLGVGDAMKVFSANLVSIKVSEAITATLFGRVVSLLVLSILGPIFSYLLLKHKPNKSKQYKNEKRNNTNIPK